MESYLDQVWRDKPEYIRKYYDLSPQYQKLCDEVSYILKTKIHESGIEISNVSSRVKKLSSFCDKIYRKTYEDPFKDITDFAGVRVVYLYLSDIEKIKDLIKSEFDVEDTVDKMAEHDNNQFGYIAFHYVVKLKEDRAGARYDDLKDLKCEIQIRTILQDAWAIVDHHLSYKSKENVPQELSRRLNALAGLFETADDQFDRIREARTEYREKAEVEISEETVVSLDKELNLDNLIAYINWKFPERKYSGDKATSELLSELKKCNYSKLIEINKVVDRSYDAVIAHEKYITSMFDGDDEFISLTGVGIIRSGLMMVDTKYYKVLSNKFNKDFPEVNPLIERYKHLIKD